MIILLLSTGVLGHYDGVDIELVLPDNLTLYDIDYLSIWCVTYRHDFGHVLIPPPKELYLPPAVGQTQVKVVACGSSIVLMPIVVLINSCVPIVLWFIGSLQKY